MLNTIDQKIKGKTVSISGKCGLGVALKVNDLGGKVVTISGPDGYMTKKEFLVINRFYARNESKR
jgi:glutamate dehydrogenase (NADP+)